MAIHKTITPAIISITNFGTGNKIMILKSFFREVACP